MNTTENLRRVTAFNSGAACEVCGQRELVEVLDLGSHPLCDDLVAVGDQRTCAEFPIQIDLCAKCLTAHQRYQVKKATLFPSSYHYRSRLTGDVLSGMDELVASVAKALGGNLRGLRVLDVGCNDGSLLDRFRSRGAFTIGLEPTGAILDADPISHVLYNCFFDVESAKLVRDTHGPIDIVTFTNVFAHISNFAELLDSLREVASDSTLIVIENHYLGSVIGKFQFDTFYHEHPRTYSQRSFGYVANRLRMPLRKVEFPSRYGGNIRVMIGGGERFRDGPSPLAQSPDLESSFVARMLGMQRSVELWRETTRLQIECLVKTHGPLLAKAFPGRAAILIKLLGLDSSLLLATYEKPASPKIGHYVPGTRIPIKSDDEFPPPDSVPILVNLAWHIPGEIRDYMCRRGYRGTIMDILDPRLAQQD